MAALVKEKALPPNFDEQQDAASSESNFLESSAQRDLRIKNAKQRDLSLAICAMPGIERARVLYDVDNRPGGPFEGKLVTATIIIKPAGAGQLEESRVLAVRHLVAGAIAGLKPENVTVSDLNGRTWHGDWKKQDPAGSGPTVPAAAPAELKRLGTEVSAEPQSASEPPVRPRAERLALAGAIVAQLALIGAALVRLLALRSMVRAQPGVAAAQTASAASDASDAATTAKPGRVPPPHWRRPQPAERRAAQRRAFPVGRKRSRNGREHPPQLDRTGELSDEFATISLDNAGVRKAAILVASLERSAADALLDQLEPQQADLVRQAVMALDEIETEERQRVLDEFCRIGPMLPEESPAGIELDGPACGTI